MAHSPATSMGHRFSWQYIVRYTSLYHAISLYYVTMLLCYHVTKLPCYYVTMLHHLWAQPLRIALVTTHESGGNSPWHLWPPRWLGLLRLRPAGDPGVHRSAARAAAPGRTAAGCAAGGFDAPGLWGHEVPQGVMLSYTDPPSSYDFSNPSSYGIWFWDLSTNFVGTWRVQDDIYLNSSRLLTNSWRGLNHCPSLVCLVTRRRL